MIERPSNSTLNKSFDLNIEDNIELFIDNINIEVNENVAEIVRRSSLKQYRTSFFFHFIFTEVIDQAAIVHVHRWLQKNNIDLVLI